MYVGRWVSEGQMEEKSEWGTTCDKWMNRWTAEGAHLLFGLFLVAADLQVILQHSAQRQRDMCYCSRDPSACLHLSRDLQLPSKNLFFWGERINYAAKSSGAGGSCWGMRKRTFAAENLPDVQLLELGKEKPDCFFTWKLSVWQPLSCSQEFLGNKEDVLGGDRPSIRIVHRWFKRLLIGKRTGRCHVYSVSRVCFNLPVLLSLILQRWCMHAVEKIYKAQSITWPPS